MMQSYVQQLTPSLAYFLLFVICGFICMCPFLDGLLCLCAVCRQVLFMSANGPLAWSVLVREPEAQNVAPVSYLFLVGV